MPKGNINYRYIIEEQKEKISSAIEEYEKLLYLIESIDENSLEEKINYIIFLINQPIQGYKRKSYIKAEGTKENKIK